MTLNINEGLLREALDCLRTCGDGRRECVCWLAGPLATPGVIDGFLHPHHRANGVEYEIEQSWLNDTFIAFAHTGRELRAQIHSHPGRAYHSPTDDSYPAIATPGFASIVVPNFAVAMDLKGAHVAQLVDDGSWLTVNAPDMLVIV